MSNKTRRNRNKTSAQVQGGQNVVSKATREQRSAKVTKATPAIHTIKQIVESLKPWELSPSNRFKTYQMMLSHSCISAAIDARISAIEAAQGKYSFKFDKNSERSVWLKDFLEHNIYYMNKTPRQIGRDAAEMVYNGISLHEVSTKLDTDGDFLGLFTLDKLTYIDPLTLDPTQPFYTESEGRTLSYWRQMKSAFTDVASGYAQFKNIIGTNGAVEIDARKVGTCGYNASSSRPLGTSILDSIYNDWREMQLIQEYLLMGIQKDLAGTPVLRVPLDLFEGAADPNSDAAATMDKLTTHMTNLHAGNQTFVILPSDTFNESGTGEQMYEMEFLGINGTNKNFDLVAIIEQKKKNIFLALGVTHLITGENGGSSYNLHEGKASVAAHYAERDNNIIDEMWNKHIIPLLLRLNNFKEKVSDIPVFKHGEVQPVSLDEKGKYINRVARMLPAVPDVVNTLLKDIGCDYRVPEDATADDLREMLFTFEDPSKVGTGDGSSGSGSTQSGGAASDTNNENAS